ncbi:MAG: hypothetical protein A2173_06765 [Planctomycetes bacterium RBG_13_44_8b]|nr:MAG: hypothetical protein A2173_06765 [Planctomycetes bacterium RBG_13_44_8b]
MIDEKNKRKQKTGGKSPSSVICLLSSVFCLLITAGCAQQQKIEPTRRAASPSRQVDKVYIPDTNKAEAFAVAEYVLSDMHFTIEKSDYQSGFIKTKPLPGAQFFELWRSDNVGAFNTAEANLHSIRRIVELQLNKYGTGFSLDCDVQVQRLELPVTHQAGYHQNLGQLTQIPGAAWTDLGKDARLATEILKRITSTLDAHHPSLAIENRESSNEL